MFQSGGKGFVDECCSWVRPARVFAFQSHSNCVLTTTSILSSSTFNTVSCPFISHEIQVQGWAPFWSAKQPLYPFNYLTHLCFTVQRSARQRQSAFDRNIRIVFQSALILCQSREILSCVALIQVICEKADRTDIPTIDKKKYLVPSVRFHDRCVKSLTRSRLGSNCWPVCVCHPQTNQAGPGEGNFHFCWWSFTTYGCPYERHIWRTQVRS